MDTFIIVSSEKEEQEKELVKLLAPYNIAPVDITRVAPLRSIGIEFVREVKKRVALKPFQSEQKAVVIEEGQLLTIEAQNALLKTLEEPPSHTIIILLTNNVDALLSTVVSRCQVIELRITNYELPKDELSALSSQLSALLGGGLGKKLAFAEKIAKDKANAITWLAKMILATRQDLLEKIRNANQPTNKESNATEDILVYLKLLRSFQKGHTLLSTTNVNPRFTLEILFLSLSK